jgi:predicted TIM-barrel fold metal-dependent hydrolase
MEGEWDAADQVGESRWMQSVADEQGAPAAHVARTILHNPGAAEEILRHAAFPIVRGIRHKPTAADRPSKVETGAAGSMSDPNWRRGYAALAPNKLHFELQTPWWHVAELMDLIEAFPETPVVINHAFMPVDRSAAGLEGWREAIQLASTAPDVVIKISGIGINGRRWALADQRPIIDACIEAFGPGRCMFASNFPVDSLVGSFDTIFDGFLEVAGGYSKREQLAMFHDNAVRVYRLDLSSVASPVHIK